MTEQLLLLAQRGLPLVPAPYAELGLRCGLSERETLDALQEALASGLARRIGGIFSSPHLGYASTLCSVALPEDAVKAFAEHLAEMPQVTHCYERDHEQNLWFTLTSLRAHLPPLLAQVRQKIPQHAVWAYPATRCFKVGVVLNTRTRRAETGALPAPDVANRDSAFANTEQHRAVVRSLQGDFPLVPHPFRSLAKHCGMEEKELLRLLSQWQQAGVLRRIALVVQHRAAGILGNLLCAWPIGGGGVPQAADILCAQPDVTHCYERTPSEAFPYSLFAMLHAPTVELAYERHRQIEHLLARNDGVALASVRQFKKSSPVFFREEMAAEDGLRTPCGSEEALREIGA